jgi:CubicO group peptidase (beta-lactamase class C family)
MSSNAVRFPQTLLRLLAVLLVAGAAHAAPAGKPAVNPGRAGLDPTKLAPLHAELQKFVDTHQVAGIVTVVGRRGQIGSVEVVGFQDLEKKTPMRPDSIFRIASQTKISTSVAVMMLEDEGKLSVDDPVEKHLPEFRGQKLVQKREGNTVTLVDPPRKITIKDLITHTSGMRCELPPGFAELYGKRNRTLMEGVIAFSQQPLETPPGTVWKYCGPSFDTLGRIIEVASGQSYESFMEQRIFKPLGMKDTSFRVPADKRSRLVTLYKKEGEGLAPVESKVGVTEPLVWTSPSGGLFSTAFDQAKLYQMLLDRGRAGSRQLLKPETVQKMTSIHFKQGPKVGFTPGLGMGLGVQVVSEPTDVSAMLSPGSFGHGGAHGTQGWMDPKTQTYYVLMIQRGGFGNGDMSDIRKAFQAIAAGAVVPEAAMATTPK